MAVRRYTLTATAGNDSRTIYEPDTYNSWIYTWDGLGGTDTLGFDRLRQSDFTLYKSADGQVHVDSVSSASHEIYVTLKNVEKLSFSFGTNVVNLSTYFGPPPNSSPTGNVAINGTATQGNTLAAAHTLADADGMPSSVNWQWKADGVSIPGAVSSTLLLTQAQVGKKITVSVSYTDLNGNSESVTSAATSAIANVNDPPIGLPLVSGVSGKGQVLQVSADIVDPDGIATPPGNALTWQWLANGQIIAGANADTFTPGTGEIGKALSARVTYRDLGGTTETLVSAATSPVISTSISGKVSYWTDARPIAAVELDVSRAVPVGNPVPLAEQTSAADGRWSIADLDFDRLIVTARSSSVATTGSDAFTGSDVLLALKFALGRPPSAATPGTASFSRIAADVDRDGSVTAHDAQLILDYASHQNPDLYAEFIYLPSDTDPTAVAGHIPSTGMSHEFARAAQVQSDWIGILLGDLDGSWHPPPV